jgi:hypothetical protein
MICPCCGNWRNESEYQQLLAFDKKHRYDHMISFLASVKNGYSDWVCDICIESKKALLGKDQLQNWTGFAYPYFIYRDQEKQCHQCHQSFIFTAQEQRFWYEELQFIVWSTPQQCPACRKAIRRAKLPHRQLTELVPNLNEEDFNELEQVINLYLQIQNVEKAKYYLSKARKLSLTRKEKWLVERYKILEDRIKIYR